MPTLTSVSMLEEPVMRPMPNTPTAGKSLSMLAFVAEKGVF